MGNFDYYRVKMKLESPMLGIASQTSIYATHVLEKAKKEIATANRMKKKVSKALAKYVGSEITPEKELAELQGVLRAYMQALGKIVDLPNDINNVLELAAELEEEWNMKLKEKTLMDAKVFLRDETGHVIIGTHMILGNLKENLKIIVNNGDTGILKSKVAVGETLALDVKPVVPFVRPSHDALKASSKEEFNRVVSEQPPVGRGKWVWEESTGRIVLERPIRFNGMHGPETAINMSEALPVGTEFEVVLRIRKASPLTKSALEQLLDYGKSNGLGAWRGSGNMGAYKYQLEGLPDYKEPKDGDWK